MPNAQLRDHIVKQANETFKKYPSVDKLPVVEGGRVVAHLPLKHTQTEYVAALYEAASRTPKITGRDKEGTSIIGEAIPTKE